MKNNTLYEDHDIILEKFPNGHYRVTLFKNCHWHGDITFDKDKIIYDGLTDENNK